MLDSLLAPLGLPRRVVRDLDAVGEAARGMPDWDRTLLERLDDIGAGLIDLEAELRLGRSRGCRRRLPGSTRRWPRWTWTFPRCGAS